MNGQHLDMKILKKQQNQRDLHNLLLHLARQYIKICVLIRYKTFKSLVKICVSKHKCSSFVIVFFSGIEQCCRTAQKQYRKLKLS